MLLYDKNSSSRSSLVIYLNLSLGGSKTCFNAWSNNVCLLLFFNVEDDFCFVIISYRNFCVTVRQEFILQIIVSD